MLRDFFKLNGTPVEHPTQEALLSHFNTSAELRNVAYTPEQLAPKGPQSRFTERALINCAFKRTAILGIKFTRCRFEDCLFLGTRFKDCEFHDCVFTGCNPYGCTFENTYIDPSAFEGLLDPHSHANIGVKLFHALYENAETTRQRGFSAAAEYNFRLWSRYQLNYERRTRKLSAWKYVQRWIPNAAYQILAGYGLRARFFTVWLTVFLVVIWIVNWRYWTEFGIVGRNGARSTATAIEALYYSVVTVTTLGFGDFTPTSSAGMLMVVLQAFGGLILLGVLGAILIRKVVR